MSDESNTPVENDKKAPEAASSELVLELNFVPQWARQPAGKNPYAKEEGAAPRDRAGRDGRRPPRKGGNRNQQDRPRGKRPPQRDGASRDHSRRGKHQQHRGRPQQHRRVDLPLRVAFIPERSRIGTLVRELKASNYAYPLMQLAALFLAKPEHHLVKIEAKKGAEKTKIFQCTVCKAVFLNEEAAKGHAVSTHLSDYYDVEEVTTDAPSGNFVCVSRCKLSGELLGPPNHHSFKQKLEELHSRRYAGMSLEQYRTKIETVRDPELIEQWKEQSRHQHRYRRKGSAEGASMTLQEAEADFIERHVNGLIKRADRVVIPATVSRSVENVDLRNLIRDAWNRESKTPFGLSLALRPALRQMGLFFFKAKGGISFVTTVEPKPIEAVQTVDTIADVLRYIEESPGCTRKNLIRKICPDKSEDSKEVADVLGPIGWLVEKGHVIEFFDGKLSLPAAAHKSKPAKKAKKVKKA